MLHAIIAHPIFKITEIAPHERESLVGLADVLLGVGILIETVEMGIGRKARQYLARVASTAKSNVDIHSTRFQPESTDALVKQHGHMITLTSLYVGCLIYCIFVHYIYAYLGVKVHKNPHTSLHLYIKIIKKAYFLS